MEDDSLDVVIVAGLASGMLEHDTRRAVTRSRNVIVIFANNRHLKVLHGAQN